MGRAAAERQTQLYHVELVGYVVRLSGTELVRGSYPVEARTTSEAETLCRARARSEVEATVSLVIVNVTTRIIAL